MSQVLFEFYRQGQFVKVAAIDVETKIEAVVIVPATLSEAQMKTQALRKLQYLINKNNQ